MRMGLVTTAIALVTFLGGAANSQSLLTIDTSAIWTPPANMHVYGVCKGERSGYEKCFLRVMEKNGASESAIQVAAQSKSSGRFGYLFGLVEAGVVDVGIFVDPAVMSEGAYYAFIVEKQRIVLLSDVLPFSERQNINKQILEPRFPARHTKYNPNSLVSLWSITNIIESTTNVDEQEIVFRWDLRESRASEIRGYVDVSFIFNTRDGNFIRYEILNIIGL